MTTSHNLQAPSTRSNSKLKELTLYISKKCFKDKHFGAIKLNKVLLFADMVSYREHGVPITSTEYRRYPNGPAPACMRFLKQELEANKDAYEYPYRLSNGHLQKQLLPLREPNLDLFKSNEIAIVDAIIEESWDLTPTQMSEMSHDLPGWQLASPNEEIPYYTSLIPSEPPEFEDDEYQWAVEVSKRIKAVN